MPDSFTFEEAQEEPKAFSFEEALGIAPEKPTSSPSRMVTATTIAPMGFIPPPSEELAQKIIAAPMRAIGTTVAGLGRAARDLMTPTTWLPEGQKPQAPFVLPLGEGEIRPRTSAEMEAAEPLQAGKPLYQPAGTALSPEGNELQRLLSRWSTPESFAVLPAGTTKAGAALLFTSMVPGLVAQIKDAVSGTGSDEEKRDRVNDLVSLAALVVSGKSAPGIREGVKSPPPEPPLPPPPPPISGEVLRPPAPRGVPVSTGFEGVQEIPKAVEPTPEAPLPAAPTGEAPKEPWQMTKAEWENGPPVKKGFTRLWRGEYKSPAENPTGLEGRWYSTSRETADFFAANQAGTDLTHIVYVDVPTKDLPKYDALNLPEKDRPPIPDEQAYVIPAELVATKKHWVDYHGDGHGDLVATAVEQGKPIPPKVLADYPDLTEAPPVVEQGAPPPRNWDTFYEDLTGELDAYNPARESGRINYELEDMASRFVDYAKADKEDRTIDQLVSDFSKEDTASAGQLRKLSQSVTRLMEREKTPPTAPTEGAPPAAPAAGKTEAVPPRVLPGAGINSKDVARQYGMPEDFYGTADEQGQVSSKYRTKEYDDALEAERRVQKLQGINATTIRRQARQRTEKAFVDLVEKARISAGERTGKPEPGRESAPSVQGLTPNRQTEAGQPPPPTPAEAVPPATPEGTAETAKAKGASEEISGQDVRQGDTIRWEPNENESRYQSPVQGIVQDVIRNTEGEIGYHIFAPTKNDPSNVVRVWSNRGKVVSRTPANVEAVGQKGVGGVELEGTGEAGGPGRTPQRPKTVVEIADEIAARGIDPQASYGEFVKARDLKPEISAAQWLPVYRKSLELAKLNKAIELSKRTLSEPAAVKGKAGEAEGQAAAIIPVGEGKEWKIGTVLEYAGKDTAGFTGTQWLIERDAHGWWGATEVGKPGRTITLNPSNPDVVRDFKVVAQDQQKPAATPTPPPAAETKGEVAPDRERMGLSWSNREGGKIIGAEKYTPKEQSDWIKGSIKELQEEVRSNREEEHRQREIYKTDPARRVMGGLASSSLKAAGAKSRKLEAQNKIAFLKSQLEKLKPTKEPTPSAPAPGTKTEMKGMGGAVPSEFEGNESFVSNMFAAIDRDREAMGKPPMAETRPRTWDEDNQRALSQMNRDPKWIPDLLDRMEKSPRPMLSWENAGVVWQRAAWKAEYNNALQRIAQAFDDNREADLTSAKTDAAVFEDKLERLDRIVGRNGTGSEAGRTLQAQKMGAGDDFTLVEMTLQKRAAVGGRRLTPEETSRIQKEVDRLNQLNSALQKSLADADAARLKAETDRAMAELKASKAPTFDQRILAAAESIVVRMERAAEPAAARLRERLMRMSAGVDPTIIYDAAIVGSARIARLGLDLAKFTDSMVKDFSEKIRPLIPEIWAKANEMIDAVKAPEPVKRAIRKTDTASVKTDVTKAIQGLVEKKELSKVRYELNKLAKAFWKEGVRDREEMVDALFETVGGPTGLTRRQVAEAFAGYGDFRQLSKDKMSVDLRGMKGELQQIAKLEAMQRGEPPLKSGLERRTPTETERQLIKRVNDAKNRFQVPVQDPNTQLKSALDTLKTTLANRIKDYEDRIARKDYAPRPSREVQLDSEATRLKAEAEHIKKRWRQELLSDRMKNRTLWEKTMDWGTKYRRFTALSSPVVIPKLMAAAGWRAVATLAEDVSGRMVSLIPGISGISKRAPIEGAGGQLRATMRGYGAAFTKGLEDAARVGKTGHSDIDVLYGKAGESYTGESEMASVLLSFPGRMHGVIKAPVKRGGFEKTAQRLGEFYAAQGLDVTSEPVKYRIALEAYKAGNRAIFLQDNRMASAFNNALAALERKGETGHASPGGKAMSTVARFMFPVTRVPVNIAAETLQYTTGTLTGTARAVKAIRNGLDTLTPDQADLIMRELKKGSIGMAALYLGYMGYQQIGGVYEQGKRPKPGEIKPDAVRMFGVDIPGNLLHHPVMNTIQLGATVHKVAEEKLRKKDPDAQGLPAGVLAAAWGLADEVPFIQGPHRLFGGLADPRMRQKTLGTEIGSVAIPQAVAWVAQVLDQRRETPPANLYQRIMGPPARLQPKNIIQSLETRIPVLRQQVPAKEAALPVPRFSTVQPP